jgi:hypothetical protein
MTRSSFVLVVVALLLPVVAGCSFVRPNECYEVDKSFTDAEYKLMLDETSALCERTDQRFCPILSRTPVANRITKTATSLGADDLGRTDMLRTYETAHIVVILRPGLSGDVFLQNFRHEMGHAGGCLEHLPAGNVMADRNENAVVDYTEQDLNCIDFNYDN